MVLRRPGTPVAVGIGRALAAAQAGVLVLWVAAPAAVVSIGGGGTPTKPSTALSLLLVAVSLGWPGLAPRVRSGLLAAAALVAVESLLVVALDLPLLSSHRLFPAAWAAVTPDGSGAMAVSSAVCVFLLAGGISLGPSRRRVTTVLGLTAFGLAFVGALGHLYGVSSFYTLQTATTMAVPTTLAVLAAAAATVVTHPSMPVPAMLTARGAAGVLVRRLLPWALLAPPALGWARLAGEKAGWFDVRFGLSLMVCAITAGAVTATVLGARSAARTDRARQAAADELELLNGVLAERVTEAVAEAEEGRASLSASEQRYRSVVASMAEGVVLRDGSGRIVTVNEAAARLLGHDVDQLLGPDPVDPRLRSLRDDGSPLPLEDHPSVVALRTGRAVRDVTMGMHRPDGSVVWLSVSAEPLLDAGADASGADASGADAEGGAGRVAAGVVTTFTDVTAARSAASALARSEEQFRHAMALAPIGMALVELDGRFREVNRTLARLVGYDADELVGLTFQQITHPDDLEADLSNVASLLDGSLDHYTMEKRFITRSGEVVWVLLAVSLAHDGEDRPAYFITQIQDVTDSRAAQERLSHRALHDPLTGLPNRDLLMDHLSHALARSARSGTSTAVMFCDLDHFKSVNDTYGHEAGDLLLVSVADRLRAVTRPGDTVARLGGDEFVVVAEALADADAVRVLADRVRRTLDEPLHLAGDVVRTGASIGVAISTAEDDARSVLREADAAMYRAKALGRGRFELSPNIA